MKYSINTDLKLICSISQDMQMKYFINWQRWHAICIKNMSIHPETILFSLSLTYYLIDQRKGIFSKQHCKNTIVFFPQRGDINKRTVSAHFTACIGEEIWPKKKFLAHVIA